MSCQQGPTSIEERKGIPVSFQHSQVLSVQFTLASQFAYFRVFVDFWNGETNNLRQVNREVDGQLRRIRKRSRRIIRYELYRGNYN